MEKDDKRKKVKSRASTKYTTSSDEASSSDDEDNLLTLFANLNMQQKEKLNELIGAIHEKDELLDSQEEFLIKENKKHVKVKNAYAQEIEKCEKLTNELSICHDTISVTPRILQLNFFSFLYSPKFGRYLFFFFLPSLHLDLFQSSSGIRFGFPV
jgi:hypothetical protein